MIPNKMKNLRDTFALKRPDWLNEFEKAQGRKLRVLHIGNIANNAFINAKIMRKIGIHADVVCPDYYHIMATPEWEEATLEGDYGDPLFPDWWRITKNYDRPEWFYQAPKRLCCEALRSQFEDDIDEYGARTNMLLATHYIAYRDSKLRTGPDKAGFFSRTLRTFAFFIYLVRHSIRHPKNSFNALQEIVPWITVVTGFFNIIWIIISIICLLPFIVLDIIYKVSVRGFVKNTNIANQKLSSLKNKFNMLMWKLRSTAYRQIIRPMLPTLSPLFQNVFGKKFSENFGATASELVFNYRDPSKVLVQKPVSGEPITEAPEIQPSALQNTFIKIFTKVFGHQITKPDSDDKKVSEHPIDEIKTNKHIIKTLKYLPEDEKRRIYLEIKNYLNKTHRYYQWTSQHMEWHKNTSQDDLKADIAFAAAYSSDWDKVIRHYDVVQGYSIDGIIPMTLGIPHFFNYEHGTLRSIPFEDTQVGRLTATAYRMGTGSMVTNIDNLASCEKLKIAAHQIVPLPHAMDDSKIHRFALAHPNIHPSHHDKPEFFSSARQHWLDKDVNYAKGNDIFLKALSATLEGKNTARVTLVEWGRDLEASKDLISDLKLSSIINWVPTMTGEELWARYLGCHAVVDQFIIPAFGRVTFDSLTLGKRVISNLDLKLAKEFFGEVPPMLVSSNIKETQAAIRAVLNDPQDTQGIGERSALWAQKYHSSQKILDLQLEAYRTHVLQEIAQHD